MDTLISAENSVTGIIICDHGSRRAQSNDSLKDVADRFGDRFAADCSIVEPAHMELAMPDINAAYTACVGRGASHIVVLPLFLDPRLKDTPATDKRIQCSTCPFEFDKKTGLVSVKPGSGL